MSKKYYLSKNQSLSSIILNLSNGIFDPLIDNIEDAVIEHQVDKSLIIRIALKECENSFINSTINILSENNTIHDKVEVESDVYDYIVFFYDGSNIILNYSLTDIYANNDKPLIFNDNLWNLYQLVDDNFEPEIIQDIGGLESDLNQSVDNYNNFNINNHG